MLAVPYPTQEAMVAQRTTPWCEHNSQGATRGGSASLAMDTRRCARATSRKFLLPLFLSPLRRRGAFGSEPVRGGDRP